VDVTLTGKNMIIDDELEAYARKRFDRLSRDSPPIERVEVVITREATRDVQGHYTCSARVVASGQIRWNGQQSAAVPRDAIDAVADLLDAQLGHEHNFVETNRRPNAHGRLPPAPEEALTTPSTLDLVLSDFGVDDEVIAQLRASGIYTMEQLEAAVDDGRLVTHLGPRYQEQARKLQRVVEKLRA
jgi:ribosome-associated translation inhibitor RaiA